MTVYEKLCKVQAELKAPKGQHNDFGNYWYRSCEDIQEGLKPLLKEVNAVVIASDEIILVGDRYYVKATVTFIDAETCEQVSNTSLARETLDKKGMDASQITGSTSSYARKYALNGLFCIDDTKDSDSNENKEQEKAKDKPKDKPQNATQQTTGNSTNRAELLKVFETEMIRTKQDREHVLKKLNVSDSKFIKTEKLIEFNEALKKLPTKE